MLPVAHHADRIAPLTAWAPVPADQYTEPPSNACAVPPVTVSRAEVGRPSDPDDAPGRRPQLVDRTTYREGPAGCARHHRSALEGLRASTGAAGGCGGRVAERSGDAAVAQQVRPDAPRGGHEAGGRRPVGQAGLLERLRAAARRQATGGVRGGEAPAAVPARGGPRGMEPERGWRVRRTSPCRRSRRAGTRAEQPPSAKPHCSAPTGAPSTPVSPPSASCFRVIALFEPISTVAPVGDTLCTVTVKEAPATAPSIRTARPIGRATSRSSSHPASGEGVPSSRKEVSSPEPGVRRSTPDCRPIQLSAVPSQASRPLAGRYSSQKEPGFASRTIAR